MFLNEDEILYVIVTSHYLTIYTYEKEYTIREPLKDFEMKLSNRFARSGISYLINISKIDKITANDVYINGKQLPLYVD